MGFSDNIPGVYAKVFSQVRTHVVIYRPESGDPVEDVSAIVTFGAQENTHGVKGDGSAWQLTLERGVRSNFRDSGSRGVATILVMASDVPDPKYGDEVEIDGETWTIAEVFDNV